MYHHFKTLIMLLPALMLFLFAANGLADGTATLFEAPGQGIRIDLPSRWEVTESGTFPDDYGGSYEVFIRDQGRAASMVLIMSPQQPDQKSIGDWIRNVAFNASVPDSVLVWYADNGKYTYGREPDWSESVATIGSGQPVTLLSTPPVTINGNRRHIRVAYFATADRWCFLFVYNQGKEKELDGVLPQILQGLHVSLDVVPK